MWRQFPGERLKELKKKSFSDDYIFCKEEQSLSFRWSNGQRKFLKLNIDQYYTSWNISVSFDREVSFEVCYTFFHNVIDLKLIDILKGMER